MVNKNLLFTSIAVLTTLIDQVTKYIAISRLSQPARVIKDVFYLNYVQNTGAGFSIFQDMNHLLIWSTLIILGIIFYYYDKIEDHLLPYVALIVGGAVGNLIDRIFYGFVIDFLDFLIWPVFNLADAAITVGGTVVLFYAIRGK